eukprot:GHUV01038194.1.p1 GENE.GHUV01038194.1~~GHUV01038194.1.p1  ORF type:complete len:492 (+),score=107.81 GHUV01038194.1:754-2229(+)
METAGLVSFQPRYLMWVCEYGPEAEECKTQCIRNGAYCCADPDDNLHEGYSGADVLLMNVRSLCFARIARDIGEPGLWWEYADKIGNTCKISQKNYNPECAEKVFKEVVTNTRLAGDTGMKAWKDCLDFGKLDGTDPIKMLDEELAAQTGEDAESTIAIMPTVRVNKRQYRGALEAPSVLRAICAGYPTGVEPSVCNEEWVSDNECKEGNDGYLACNSNLNSTLGRTKCVNTFNGYRCECGEGFMKVVDKATSVDTCAEINECLVSSIPWTKENCKCERCACINTVGSYNCTGPLTNMCVKEHNWGGCWKKTIGGKFYTSCRDDIKLFRWMSQYGMVNESTQTFQCQCPPCFRETASGSCEPACDLSVCNSNWGSDGCSALKSGRITIKKGISGVGVFFLLLATMAITAGCMYGVYQVYLRKRMHDDMRNILEEYVPLASAPPPESVSLVPESFTDTTTPRHSYGVSTPKGLDEPLSLNPSRLSNGSGGNQ